jgi:magnesium chelatase family protein
MIYNSRTISNSLGKEMSILVETNVSDKGIPVFEIFGLISKSIEESKKRIITAFNSCGIEFPLKSISVNLSPAELYKEGTYFDLSIAVTILQYTHKIKVSVEDIFIGELSFDGSVRGVSNLLFLTLVAKDLGYKKVFIPQDQVDEVKYIKGIDIYGVSSLSDLLNISNLSHIKPGDLADDKAFNVGSTYNQILGNENGKKVLAYCLAGKHNMLLEGFPGAGKSLLAKAAVDLLPKMDTHTLYKVLKIHSYSGINRTGILQSQPPFRSPHSSSSYSAIFGTTGNKIYPGELALADGGVLFLDEFPEFNRSILEGLRSPLEDKLISISRGKLKVVFPCDFILIATQNPCKCGYFNHPKIICRCTPSEISRYKNKISGPILDRIDIHFNFPHNNGVKISDEYNSYPLKEFNLYRDRVVQVRDYLSNLKNTDRTSFDTNKNMSNINIQSRICNSLSSLLASVQEKYSISNRKVFKLINLSFTISLFNNSEEIKDSHFFEALQLSNIKI